MIYGTRFEGFLVLRGGVCIIKLTYNFESRGEKKGEMILQSLQIKGSNKF